MKKKYNELIIELKLMYGKDIICNSTVLDLPLGEDETPIIPFG